MAETKTKATAESVDEYIERVPDHVRRADAKKLRALMERLSGKPARMWGPSIIGFGSYHYKYDSGHEGDAARIGFSPRARELVLYLFDSFEGKEDRLARLGKHRIGKCCLYIKKLSDVDEAVLEEMIVDSIAWMDEKYPE
ncbi:DUF1801 domain-containing protein [Allosphingosinicella sp.]|jgi:hypothetical protein|uniref:DUF1801 domain-containing protein n=1 Tax=Allosphingosinicella sp. TaxID=2823234 RepID=UPI002F06BEDF